MAATEADSSKEHNAAAAGTPSGPVDALADSLANANVQDDKSHEKANQSPREPHVYTRVQLLWISKSPLVKAPEGMPALKDWFGDWSEQQVANKKEGESSSNGTGTRDRRFRRDPEEGDAPTRPSFRSSLSQPSQMGNFRHQSLRTADRERERDPERERQREERDREGQERLRNLSDKYDRERLALSSATGALRGKERESAPHLASTARNGQSQTASARRAEGREAAKKKPGEVSDDWRRGAEPPSRGGRDERPETARRDRGGRDSSRTRREPSSTRRDRDNKERDRSRRRDERDDRRDRDDHLRRDWDDRDDGYRDRDRYDYNRRDTDRDRELEEDPRRWRDDGKREERQSQRRDRERDRDRERAWDRWEPSHDRERLDDRDGRGKRTGRDRRSGAGLDDAKDKEEKKEREKEKEPAWMETYIPSTPGGGILGGQLADGELDGIQAWKKGLKEKERKEKEAEQAADSGSKPPAASTTTAASEAGAAATSDGPIDEIQLFKMMMKQSAAQKDMDPSQASPISPPGAMPTAIGRTSPPKLKDPAVAVVSTSAGSPIVISESSSMAHASSSTSQGAQNEGAKLLSLLSQLPADASAAQSSKFPSPAIPAPDTFPPAVSRMFPTPPGLSPSVSQNSERPTVDLSTPSFPNTPFDPPAASRLLAFGARAGPGAQVPPKNLQIDPGNMPFGGNQPPPVGTPSHRPPGVGALGGVPNSAVMQQGHELMFSIESESHTIPNPRATPSERSVRSFSPFGQGQPQHQFGVHDVETMRLPQAEGMRRLAPERGMAIGPDGGLVELGGPPANFSPAGFEIAGNAGPTSSAAKGSRFVKFFGQKGDAQVHPQAQGLRKGPGGNGFMSTSPLPGQGRDALMVNGMANTPGEGRSMEDLFAMLQSSTQNHRASPQSGRVSAAGAPFGQAPIDLHVLQQQQQLQQLHQQQLMQQQNRLDSLYDSRMDDRNFVPDGMVPGLRPAQRPRSREPVGLHFNDHLDEPLQVNPRLAQGRGGLEQLYSGPAPAGYGRNVGGIQQNQFRGGPGALPGQNIPQGHPQQRFQPGLANLGGRPPHDASQFLNNQLNNIPPHGGMHLQQQTLNNFAGAGFNGPIQRGPINPPHHNNAPGLNQLGGMGPGNGVDLRMHNQAQLLNLNNASGLGVNQGMGGGPRGGGIGFNGQQASAAQLQAQQLALRQQQQQQHQHQQQLQQLGMPQAHLLPPHIQQHQQQQNLHAVSPDAADLISLLMGGQRE